MIVIDNKIKNIYYMLCYSFNKDLLKEKAESDVSEEAFENIYNLFSIILCIMLKKQIKKGIHKDYIYKAEEIKTIKGKININESLNNNSFVNKRIYCEYDEFSENNFFNRIIKTTVFYLIKSNKIGKFTKNELKKCMIYFGNVEIIKINNINWKAIKFNKNNISYRNILLICELIIKGLIVSDKKGNDKFKEFLDATRVSAIFENFIREFYKKHYPEFNAKSKIMYLNEEEKTSEYMPLMKTDITLECEEKTLIIDAKFYDKIIRDGFHGSKVLSSANLYQILSYVDNQDPYKTDSVYGMLLYAQTLNDHKLNEETIMNKHTIIIRTIDLNEDWEKIKENLIEIAEWFKMKSKLNSIDDNSQDSLEVAENKNNDY